MRFNRQTKLHHKIAYYLDICESFTGSCSVEPSLTTTSLAEVEPTHHIEMSSIEDECDVFVRIFDM
jgi:type IV pilus biogenesis protein CpaD/CtpE